MYRSEGEKLRLDQIKKRLTLELVVGGYTPGRAQQTLLREVLGIYDLDILSTCKM